MISSYHWLIVAYMSTVLGLMVTCTPADLSRTDDENEVVNKRAWNDVSSSWGKRGWNDLESSWGKRAWERLNGAWGKRLTLNPEESLEADLLNEISKRPEWSKLKGSWGKRVPDGEKAGWANLKGLWGKRAWEKLGNSWGKRTTDLEKVSSQNQPLENLHSLVTSTGQE